MQRVNAPPIFAGNDISNCASAFVSRLLANNSNVMLYKPYLLKKRDSFYRFCSLGFNKPIMLSYRISREVHLYFKYSF